MNIKNFKKVSHYFFLLLLICTSAFAEDKSGVKPNVLSLPSGPSSIEGLGKSFEPQLNTGSASYSVEIQVPPGTAGHTPSVSLNYSGGKGSGHFGLGWSLNLHTISRQTDKGTPSYTDADTFIFSGGEELVPLNNGTYRTENESGFMRFSRVGDGWEITDKAGRIYRLGQYPDASNPARTSRIGNGGNSFNQTYKWYLTSFEDTNGNRIEYFYQQILLSPGELFLSEIRYNINGADYNAVIFDYESRPDVVTDYTAGFQIKTGHRAFNIKVLSQGNLIREYLFDYDSNQSEVYDPFITNVVNLNTSILTKVTQLDNTGTGLNYLPPIRFGYTRLFTADQDLLPSGNFPGPEDIDLNGNGNLDLASPVILQSAPVNVNFQDGNAELLDVNADGLPDVFHTPTGEAKHAYYLNLDGVNFAPQAEMLNRPFVFLSSTGASLADINGDGVTDLINKPSASLFTLFSNRANGGWAPGLSYTTPMFSDLSDPNVRFIDIDFDKKIDIVRSVSGSSWEICRHGIEADQDLAPFDNFPFPGPEDIDHNGNGVLDAGSWNCTGNNPMPFSPSIVFSNPEVHLADLNGDRLQDMVWLRLFSSTEAYLFYWPNLGNGQFGNQVTIPAFNPSTLNSANLHLSDVNGDGLTDVVKITSGLTTVWFNIGGDQMSEPTSFNSPAYNQETTEIRFADMNGNGSRDVLWIQATGTERYQYLDFTPLFRPNLLNLIDNGLGRQIKIQYKSSTKYAIDAAADGNPWTKFSPTSTSVVSRMVVTPGLELDRVIGQDQYITDYVYRDPYYDAYENEFRGFGFVKKIERGDVDAPTKVTRYFFHTGAPDGIDNDGDGKIDERSLTGGAEDEPLKGRVLSQEVTTTMGGADTSVGDGLQANDNITFTRITNQWQLRQIYAQSNGSQPQSPLNDKVVSYAYLEQANTQILELGTGTPKNLLSTFAYDDFGNQTEERSYGVSGINGDERFTFTTFINNTSLWNVGLQSEVLVTDGNLNKVTQTRNYYDGQDFIGLSLGQVAAGNLMRQEKWEVGTKYIQAKRNRYDSYGNITGTYDPQGVVGQNKHFSEVVYDSTFHLFPISETFHVGDGKPALGMNASYNLGFGIMLSSTDFNGNDSTYSYDSFGRITGLVKPGDTTGLPTMAYTYRIADPVRAKVYNYDKTGNLSLQSGLISASSIETRQREVSGQAGTLDSFQYIDGMGRELASVQESNIGWVVHKFTQFNSRGSVRETYQPFTISSSTYSQLNQGIDLTKTRYDEMGRAIEITNPPETSGGVTTRINTSYTPLIKTIFDELNNEKVYINDGLKRLIEVQEVNQSDRYITRYTYNPADSLTLITDAQLNQRIFNYDGLQRRIFMNDPNKGVMNWIYDNASNVIETLDAKGQQNLFSYDGVNRMLTEDYADEGFPFSANASPDVSYNYDIAASVDQGDGTSQLQSNTKGHLVSVTDLSAALISLPDLPAGEEHHSYDERGRSIWTVKRIPDIKTNTLVSYKTSMGYDTFDRVTDITYPDGDHISQAYNGRGLLDSISGGSSGFIVNNLQYKPSGQLAHSQFGNGTVNDLDYDPRLRMTSLQSSGQLKSLLDYAYSFDGTSNVSRIDDNRPVLDVAQGSPERNTQIFAYDDLYRLNNVQYSFNGPGSPDRDDGSIAYSYDKIGNMTSKISAINHLENGLSITNLGSMTYGGSTNGSTGRIGRGAGDAPGPHALSKVAEGTRNYSYDDNGNMLDINGMQLTWDFKDRLVSIEDTNMRAEYSYDYNNQRVMKHVVNKTNNKRARPETTLYVNEYFEVREYDQPIKYVFQGGKRIARATENLDNTTNRTQRLRLSMGWNLVSIAISATDTFAQLGVGADILSMYLWNPQTSSYDVLNVGSSIPAASVVWIESASNKVVSISGSYSDPSAPITSVGSAFIGHDNLSYALSLGDDLPSDVNQAWVFDAKQQRWTALLSAPLAAATDLPENLAPGGVAYVSSTTSQAWNTPSTDSTLQYYHQDHIGSNDTITNNLGGVQSKNKFYPFGYNRQIGSSLKPDPYGFTDKEKDKESKLNYFEARYLSSNLGRFASVDPMLIKNERFMDPQRWNVYGYGRNNPNKYVDPDGEALLFGAIVGAVLDIAIQSAEIALTDKTLSDFSITSVVISAGSGAIGVGLASKINQARKLSTFQKFSASVAGDAVVSAGSTKLKGEKITGLGLAADVVLGQAGGRLAGKYARNKAIASSENSILNRQANRADRIANNPKVGRPEARQRQAQHAHQAQINFVENADTKAGIIASGLGQTGAQGTLKLMDNNDAQ